MSKTKITIRLPKPRNKHLNDLLLEKSKGGGEHVPKEDKRLKDKIREEIEEELWRKDDWV